MQTIPISKARKRLPELVNKAYRESKSFLITKGGVPMAKIIKSDKVEKTKKYSKKRIERALKTARKIKWVWDDEWKGKSTVEISRLLRERAEKSHAS